MSRKVLIVDDDAVNILVRLLEKNGYAVRIAKDGLEAIRRFTWSDTLRTARRRPFELA